MHKLAYNDLVERYGHDMAYGLLLTIEQMAKIKFDTAVLHEDMRLEIALGILDNSSPLN